MSSEISFQLSAADGAPLGAWWYSPPGPARAVVVTSGATAVPQRFYQTWARDLADRGYDVLTFDFRGIAESRHGSLRGFRATMSDWGRGDLQGALDLAAQRAGDRPLLLVGHSFGGQALGLARTGGRLAGVVTVGAQLGYYGHWPARTRPYYAALWYAAVPAIATGLGYVPGRLGLGEDLPAGVAKEWSRWCRSPGYLLDHVPDAVDRFSEVDAPARVISISDDDYAPEPAVRAFAARLPRSDRVRWTPADAGVEKLGHFGFFRPTARKLWDEVARFLDQRVDEARRRTA
jgi:predicted alpha/beta hydrolase